jgi:hypothetical protein
MKKARFESELVEGHKGVVVALVPFDPEAVWKLKPVRLDPRRDGWLVKGTIDDVPFDGYIGYRWNRFFVIVDPDVREHAKARVGDRVAVTLEPTLDLKSLARAREQSKLTTAPKKGRADAIELDAPLRSPSARSPGSSPGTRRRRASRPSR